MLRKSELNNASFSYSHKPEEKRESSFFSPLQKQVMAGITKLSSYSSTLTQKTGEMLSKLMNFRSSIRSESEPVVFCTVYSPMVKVESISVAKINEFKTTLLPPKPSRFSLKGLFQTIENQYLRFKSGDAFADRKTDKLLKAVDSWEKTILGADNGDVLSFKDKDKDNFKLYKNDFKLFLKAEAQRYIDQSKTDKPTVEHKLMMAVNMLLKRVEIASNLKLNATDCDTASKLVMGEGTSCERTYDLGDVFAAGTSGLVRSATFTPKDGVSKEVVVKELFVPLMGQTDMPRIVDFSDAVLELLNERDLHLSDGSSHPRLAETLDSMVTRDKNGIVRLHVCMEKLGDSGEKIATSLHSEPLSSREAETKKMLKEVGEGLDFMHNKSMMHRDIKPANIAKRGDDYVILDFGAAGRTGKESSDTSITAGSAFFRAPEVMTASKETPYTTSADIFSLGATAFQMIAGTEVAPSFGDRDTYPVGEEDDCDRSFTKDTLEKAFSKEPWNDVSSELKSLIQRMLDPDPSLRPTAREVSTFF